VVEEGLQAGDEIVVNGAFTVDAAVQLAGKPSMMNPGEQPESSESNSNFSLSEEEKEKLKPVFDDYLSLKDALVEDDFQKAKKAVSGLENSVKNLEVSEFDSTAEAALKSYKTNLKKQLEIMNAASEISALRSEFDEFSLVMIRMAQSFRPYSDKLYIQRCPMANQDRGADWLSLSEEIRNPYYGSMMLKCGEVTGIVE
jgi:Cu(I)/Ag(I) efflux system membrane fusion protein